MSARVFAGAALGVIVFVLLWGAWGIIPAVIWLALIVLWSGA